MFSNTTGAVLRHGRVVVGVLPADHDVPVGGQPRHDGARRLHLAAAEHRARVA